MNESSKKVISVMLYYFLYLVMMDYFNNRVLSKSLFEIFKQKSNSKVRKACKEFGIRYGRFKKMTERELKDIFRKTVIKKHPDHGGDPTEFRAFKESYDILKAAV